jgi:hypothetical protein
MLLLVLLVPLCCRAQTITKAILSRVQQLLQQLPLSFFSPVLDPGGLADSSAAALLRDVNDALKEEYTLRRKMLIERIKVSIAT